jgi:hypothetical protein
MLSRALVTLSIGLASVLAKPCTVFDSTWNLYVFGLSQDVGLGPASGWSASRKWCPYSIRRHAGRSQPCNIRRADRPTDPFLNFLFFRSRTNHRLNYDRKTVSSVCVRCCLALARLCFSDPP